MSSLLYRTEPSYQNRMNAIVWFEIPAWELWKSMSRGRLIIMCCSGCFCLSVFMVPTLSNQKITSPILLDLFLMAFFSSLLLLLEKQEKKVIMFRSHHRASPPTQRRRQTGGFIRFLLRLNEMREECQHCTVSSSSPVSPNNTISDWQSAVKIIIPTGL